MKTVCFVICVSSLFGQTSFGQELQQATTVTETVGVGSAIAYQTALARADVAIAKSLLNERLLKGGVGEAIRDQTLARYRHNSGQWINVSPRLGPQGLDHVSVQLNEAGVPHRLMVDETKYGSSQLSTTKSGEIQMGDKYVSERLSGLAKRYDIIRAQAQGEMLSAKAPSGLWSKRIISVPLSYSKSIVFWRPAEGAGPWRYDGPTESLPKAIEQLKYMADLFRAGADGRIDFPKRIFQVKPDGDSLKVNILDATAVDASGGNLSKLPVKAEIKLPTVKTIDVIQAKIADELRRQMPHLDSAEAQRLAQGIQSTAKTAEEALSRGSFRRFAALQTTKVGTAGVLVAVPIEIAFQLLGEGPMGWSHIAGVGGLAGGSAIAGNALGNATTYALVRTELGYSASVAAAEIMGLRSASRFANVTGGSVGGGATAILFVYGGYWLGYYDLQTANRFAIAGVSGVGASAAASAATWALIGTYATASTGTAISTLGGVALSNANWAWLGGGSLATGGFGMAGGWVVLTGGGAIVSIGATAAVMYGFYVYDEYQDRVRLTKTLEYLSDK